MQALATAAQMQLLDRTAIEKFRIPGIVLMENAGRSFVEVLAARVPDLFRKRVLIFCGKGNNGGDGFVIARHLVNRGGNVTVVVLARFTEIKGDAQTNLLILRQMMRTAGEHLRIIPARRARALSFGDRPDVIIDALFGTGFSGAPAGMYDAAIAWINASAAFVASVDIPSGIHGSTGRAAGNAVRAALTVTMGLAKTGNYLCDGAERCGEVVVGDISMPAALATGGNTWRVLQEDVQRVLPRRPLRLHKYSAGKVFVLAGSRAFTGAAVLCAEAALRAGAGAVYLGIPRSIHQIIARKVTEVLILPLEETPAGTVAPSSLHAIQEKCAWADAVAIGPGLGRNAETDALVRVLLPTITVPVVLDADGLTAIAGHTAIVKGRKSGTILTPHAGELARIVGGSAENIDLQRLESARSASKSLRSVLVLKGAPTVTSAPGGESFVNSTGNPGMATIGAGDVLTGIIAGLCAQKMTPVQAAWSGVYLHGKAGDIAAREMGERSLLAGDMLRTLGRAMTW